MVTRWLRVLAGFAMALSAVASEAQAQGRQRYILRCLDASVGTVLARHELIPVEVLRDDDQPILLVEGPDDRSEVELELEVGADVDVLAFERDRRLVLSERQPAPALNQSVASILEALSTNTPVRYFGAPAPLSYASQPAGRILQLGSAHQMATGNVIVAVIDTGVDATHPLLRDVVVPGFDFTRNLAGTPSDMSDLQQSVASILEQSVASILEQRTVQVVNGSTAAVLGQSVASILEGLPPSFGHGTMIAGLIHYVAPTAQIMPLKAFHADGSSRLSDIIQAVYYAVDHGARVINLSFSAAEKSGELSRALNYAQRFRTIPVAAAGNEGDTIVRFPAGDSHAIAVGSTTTGDTLSAFSNYGVSPIRLAAPGETLVTCYPAAHWAAVSGSSFSTALVAGAIALQIQVNPQLSISDARNDLKEDAIPVRGIRDGRIDLPRAIRRSAQRR